MQVYGMVYRLDHVILRGRSGVRVPRKAVSFGPRLIAEACFRKQWGNAVSNSSLRRWGSTLSEMVHSRSQYLRPFLTLVAKPARH